MKRNKKKKCTNIKTRATKLKKKKKKSNISTIQIKSDRNICTQKLHLAKFFKIYLEKIFHKNFLRQHPILHHSEIGIRT